MRAENAVGLLLAAVVGALFGLACSFVLPPTVAAADLPSRVDEFSRAAAVAHDATERSFNTWRDVLAKSKSTTRFSKHRPWEDAYVADWLARYKAWIQVEALARKRLAEELRR